MRRVCTVTHLLTFCCTLSSPPFAAVPQAVMVAVCVSLSPSARTGRCDLGWLRWQSHEAASAGGAEAALEACLRPLEPAMGV